MKLSALLAALVLAAAPHGDEYLYPDLPASHWAAPAVREVTVTFRVMSTFEDGTFRGEANVNRIGLCRILLNLIRELESMTAKELLDSATSFYSFRDVADTEDREIAETLANEYSLFDGVPGIEATRLSGKRPVTRYELAAILAKLIRLLDHNRVLIEHEEVDESLPFGDVGSQHWAHGAVVSTVLRYQVLDGLSEGRFAGDREINRFHLASGLSRTLGLIRRRAY